MYRGVVLFLAVLLGAGGLGVPSTAIAASSPRCHGKVATIVMTEPGWVSITEPNAVVIGTDGDDSFSVLAPNALVCAGAGEDYALEPNGTATLYLGSGNDHLLLSRGSVAYGESGDDWSNGYGGTFYGGSGNDGMYVDGGGTAFGGSGDDYMAVGPDGIVDGGSGNDDIRAGDARSLKGGSGSDIITIWSGDPAIDCGPNGDTLVLQVAVTSYRRCEIVS